MRREELRAVFGAFTVGIAGAGGLGSNCAAFLVRAGVRSLVIADFDTVSEANLDRQFYFLAQAGRPKVEALAENLRAIEPSLDIAIHDARVGADNASSLFADCDVLVEAFDDAEAKETLIESSLSAFPDRPIVAASGLAGLGNLDRMRTVRNGTLVVCGDFESAAGPENPPLAPRVALVAAMQADAVLGLLLELARR